MERDSERGGDEGDTDCISIDMYNDNDKWRGCRINGE